MNQERFTNLVQFFGGRLASAESRVTKLGDSYGIGLLGVLKRKVGACTRQGFFLQREESELATLFDRLETYLDERQSLAAVQARPVFAHISFHGPVRQSRRPKGTKSMTGRFVGDPLPATRRGDGNVLPALTSDMRLALEGQRRMSGLAPTARGAAIGGTGKPAASSKQK